MRILHIDTGREMRGGQYQALFLSRELGRLGHEQRIFARAGWLEAPDPSWSGLYRLRAWPDVIHAHDARAHALAALVPWRGKLVVARRVAFPIKRGVLSRWKYGRADRYLAVSKFVAGLLREAAIPAARIRLVPDCVPLLTPRPPDGRIVAPATNDPAKGSDFVRATGLAVTFSRDLQHDLPGASAFLYMTRSEGLGSAALLAMSAGVPVIASAIGGLPEIVVDGETGLLTPNDPASAAKQVQRVLADPALAKRLAVAARARVEREFTPEQVAKQTLAAYLD